MWRDLVIGSGSPGNTAIQVLDANPEGAHKYSVSQNKVAFWISDATLGLGLTLIKGSTDFDQMSALVKDRQLQGIVNVVDELMFRRVCVQRLREAITNGMADAYRRGDKARLNLIRQALGD